MGGGIQVNFRRSVAKQQLSAPSLMNARSRKSVMNFGSAAGIDIQARRPVGYSAGGAFAYTTDPAAELT